mmetsp:Transcript_10991/g.67949  ORF Transcript_10991/g.67949 Transcript_10991/m.67949 type:complete len:102 (+) Transcript_10991:492-797(+)
MRAVAASVRMDRAKEVGRMYYSEEDSHQLIEEVTSRFASHQELRLRPKVELPHGLLPMQLLWLGHVSGPRREEEFLFFSVSQNYLEFALVGQVLWQLWGRR